MNAFYMLQSAMGMIDREVHSWYDHDEYRFNVDVPGSLNAALILAAYLNEEEAQAEENPAHRVLTRVVKRTIIDEVVHESTEPR